MANNLSKNLTQTASRRFIEGFANNMVALRNVDRQILEGVFNPRSGDTVTLKVPAQYKSVDLLSRDGGKMTSADVQAIETGTIPAKINSFKGITVEVNKIQKAIEADQLDELLEPITRRLVQDFELEIFEEAAKMAAGMVGDVSNGAVKNWKDMREVKAYFTKIGAGASRPTGFFDPDVFTDISADVKTSFNPDLVKESITEYYGGRLAGVDTFETMSGYTFGDAAIPSAGALASEHNDVYSSLDDVHSSSLTLKTGKTVKRGMKFTIAGVFAINQETKQVIKEKGANKLQVFTVTKDSAGTSVAFSPALIGDSDSAYQNVSAKGAQDAAVTFINTKGKVAPTVWNSGAIAVAFVPLEPVSTAEGYTARQDNVAIRAQTQGSVMDNTDVMRFDVMAAIKIIDPMKVLLAYSQA